MLGNEVEVNDYVMQMKGYGVSDENIVRSVIQVTEFAEGDKAMSKVKKWMPTSKTWKDFVQKLKPENPYMLKLTEKQVLLFTETGRLYK